MSKVVRFVDLILENFTSHRNAAVEYSDLVRLSGKNGEGKTSIGTAPVWVLYGTDLLGKTFNPTPTNYDYDRVYASLLLSVDGILYKFTREIVGGKNAFYVNDVPSKSKEFDTAVAALFDRETFMSLYYPAYFFGQHWQKQRELVMRGVTAPAMIEVFGEMSRGDLPKETPWKAIPLNPAAAKLSELVKKHSIDDLLKIHSGTGGQKSKLEKQVIAAQSRTKTLREQLDRQQTAAAPIDMDALKIEDAALLEQINEVEKEADLAAETNRKITALDAQIKSLYDRAEQMKVDFFRVRDKEILENCQSCGQQLDEASRTQAEESKKARLVEINTDRSAVIAQRKELEAERAALEPIDVSELMVRYRELEAQRRSIMKAASEAVRGREDCERLADEVKKATADEAKTMADLKESIFILDAIKEYRAKEAELQAAKVQSLFTTLSIRLFEYVKTRDEYEPFFSIQMDGKDYGTLSVGEKIAAGLELAEFLYKQSELVAPAFVDNIESYTGRVAVFGQLITGQAVKNQELKIETEAIT